MSENIRKLIVQVEQTRTEMGRPVDPPTRKARAARSLGVAVKTIYNKLEAWGIGGQD